MDVLENPFEIKGSALGLGGSQTERSIAFALPGSNQVKLCSSYQNFNQRSATTGHVRLLSPELKGRDGSEIRCSMTGMKGRYRAIRIFLVGVLCGAMIAAAVAFGLTIPANSDYWRMEIWKRGGGAWTFDKNGHLSWSWTVEPVSDLPRQKRVIIPSSQTKIRSEQL